MLLEHFKLRTQPFGVTPDARFLHMSRTHREAITSLPQIILQNDAGPDSRALHATRVLHTHRNRRSVETGKLSQNTIDSRASVPKPEDSNVPMEKEQTVGSQGVKASPVPQRNEILQILPVRNPSPFEPDRQRDKP